MISRRLRTLGLTAILLVLNTPAMAGLFMVGDSGDLFEMKTQSGPIVTIGNTGLGVLDALTISSSGTLYTTTGSALYTLDKTNASATLIGNMGITGVEGLAIDNSGNMYAASGNALYTVNTSTGASSFAGSVTHIYDDLLFATTDISYSGGTIAAGTLLGLDATLGIYSIDTTTFAETLIEAIPVSVADEAFASDGNGGLIGHNFNREAGGLGGLYDIDLSGGNADTLISTAPAAIRGLAMETSAVPLPGTLWLWSMGAMLLGLGAGRRSTAT